MSTETPTLDHVNNFIGFQGYRITKYTPKEVITDPEGVLEKWDNLESSASGRHLRDIRDRIDVQDLNMRTLKVRLAKQEHTLKHIR